MRKKKTKPTDLTRLEGLLLEMEEASRIVGDLPDYRECTMNKTDLLEGLRSAALGLAREIEDLFAALDGRPQQ